MKGYICGGFLFFFSIVPIGNTQAIVMVVAEHAATKIVALDLGKLDNFYFW